MGGQYAFYIWSAYVFAGATLAAMVIWAMLDHRTQARALARLEARRGTEPSRADEPVSAPPSLRSATGG